MSWALQDSVTIDLPTGRIVYCCPRSAHFVVAYRLFMWRQEQGQTSAIAMTAKLEALADASGVGITEHRVAISRARSAVQTVNKKLDQLKAKGDLRDLNQDFKVAREVDPAIRWQDYLQTRKACMIEAVANGSVGL